MKLKKILLKIEKMEAFTSQPQDLKQQISKGVSSSKPSSVGEGWVQGKSKLEVIEEGFGDMCIGGGTEIYHIIKHLKYCIGHKIERLRVIITHPKYEEVALKGFEAFKEQFENLYLEIPEPKDMLIIFKTFKDQGKVRVYEFKRGENYQ